MPAAVKRCGSPSEFVHKAVVFEASGGGRREDNKAKHYDVDGACHLCSPEVSCGPDDETFRLSLMTSSALFCRSAWLWTSTPQHTLSRPRRNFSWSTRSYDMPEKAQLQVARHTRVCIGVPRNSLLCVASPRPNPLVLYSHRSRMCVRLRCDVWWHCTHVRLDTSACCIK